MGWAKSEDAVASHKEALLVTYGQLTALLARGCEHPGLAVQYCRALVTHIKMQSSLRRNVLRGQPIEVEKVLRALPPVSLVLMRRR